MVDLGGDPAHDAAAAAGEKVLGLAMAEIGIEAAAQEQVALELEGRDPGGPSVQSVGQLDKRAQITDAPDRGDLDRHSRSSYMLAVEACSHGLSGWRHLRRQLPEQDSPGRMNCDHGPHLRHGPFQITHLRGP